MTPSFEGAWNNVCIWCHNPPLYLQWLYINDSDLSCLQYYLHFCMNLFNTSTVLLVLLPCVQALLQIRSWSDWCMYISSFSSRNADELFNVSKSQGVVSKKDIQFCWGEWRGLFPPPSWVDWDVGKKREEKTMFVSRCGSWGDERKNHKVEQL